MIDYLKHIEINLPITDSTFKEEFLDLFAEIGEISVDRVNFSPVTLSHYPHLSLRFADASEASAAFSLGDQIEVVPIKNSTHKIWNSPYVYQSISVGAVRRRLQGMKLTRLDHMGFNLPWKKKECHPNIGKLRVTLANRCLYHLWPKNRNWDFILPGNEDEILSSCDVDYSIERRPKFEIVSFRNSSTPLIQFEVLVSKPFEYFSPLFPEAIQLLRNRSVWIYIKNNSDVEMCLVLNEDRGRDWSKFFTPYRLGSGEIF